MGKSRNYCMETCLGIELGNGHMLDTEWPVFLCVMNESKNLNSFLVSASSIRSFVCASAVFRMDKICILKRWQVCHMPWNVLSSSLAKMTCFPLSSTSESWGGGSSGWFKYHLEKCDWLSAKPNKWGSDNYSFAPH